MKIQFNTDKNVEGTEDFSAIFIDLITEQLSRFENQITRLEVHLSDEDGSKDGQCDMRCMLEARLEGMQPIAVTNVANTAEKAVKGAVDKMKNSLQTLLGRSKNY